MISIWPALIYRVRLKLIAYLCVCVVVCHIFDVSSYALKVHSHPDDIKAVVVFFASMRSNNSALECHRRRATAFGFSFIFEARMREIMCCPLSK